MIQGIFYSGDQFFRFYTDGTFLDCLIRKASSADFDNISTWFTRESKLGGIVRGQYEMDGKRITFKTVGHFGDGVRTVNYTGTYSKSGLTLDSLDHNTGHRTSSIAYRPFAGGSKAE